MHFWVLCLKVCNILQLYASEKTGPCYRFQWVFGFVATQYLFLLWNLVNVYFYQLNIFPFSSCYVQNKTQQPCYIIGILLNSQKEKNHKHLGKINKLILCFRPKYCMQYRQVGAQQCRSGKFCEARVLVTFHSTEAGSQNIIITYIRRR